MAASSPAPARSPRPAPARCADWRQHLHRRHHHLGRHLQIGNGGTTGTIAGNVTDNGVLAFNRTDSVTYGGVVSGTGSLTQAGSGTPILTGANTYSGGTTISAGTLQIGNGGTTGAIAGNVVDNGVLAFNRSDSITFAGNISGSGSVLLIGTGTVSLTGTNTYTGGTAVGGGGTILAGSDAALGAPGSSLTLSGRHSAGHRQPCHHTPGHPGRRRRHVRHRRQQPHPGRRRLRRRFAHQVRHRHTDPRQRQHLQRRHDHLRRHPADRQRRHHGSIAGNVTDNGVLAFNRSDATYAGGVSAPGACQARGGTLT